MRLSDIIRSLRSIFERKRNNPIQLDNDSNLESKLKSLKVSNKNTPIQISEDTVDVKGNLKVNGVDVSTGSAGATELNELSDVTYSSGDLTISSLDTIVAGSDLTLDVTGDIELNADGGDVTIKDDTDTLASISGTEFYTKGNHFIKEIANAEADNAGQGQIWVKNETPNCLAFTDDAGTDIVGIGKYHYETKICNFYSSVSSEVYLPIAGYVIERTSTTGLNEFISMIAPYDCTIEKFAFRSEAQQGTGSGTMRFVVLESQDNTEVPGTILFRKDLSSLNIADDTYTEYDLTSPSVGSFPIQLTKGRIYAFGWTPAATPYDVNTILVFKWDITS